MRLHPLRTITVTITYTRSWDATHAWRQRVGERIAFETEHTVHRHLASVPLSSSACPRVRSRPSTRARTRLV